MPGVNVPNDGAVPSVISIALPTVPPTPERLIHEHAVARELRILLDVVGAELDRVVIRREGVLRARCDGALTRRARRCAARGPPTLRTRARARSRCRSSARCRPCR